MDSRDSMHRLLFLVSSYDAAANTKTLRMMVKKRTGDADEKFRIKSGSTLQSLRPMTH